MSQSDAILPKILLFHQFKLTEGLILLFGYNIVSLCPVFQPVSSHEMNGLNHHVGMVMKSLKYSGTSVYVRFGISPTYTSCLDAKNFAWYTTFVWNTTRVLELVWVLTPCAPLLFSTLLVSTLFFLAG
jgi:hypothetical protein